LDLYWQNIQTKTAEKACSKRNPNIHPRVKSNSSLRTHDKIVARKDYGKDLAVEVGMAYAWKMPSIGIDYDAKDSDVMSYFALDKIIKPEDLEKTLAEYR
jgi:hypothetical protein